MEPTTLVYWEDALTKWVTQPRHEVKFWLTKLSYVLMGTMCDSVVAKTFD